MIWNSLQFIPPNSNIWYRFYDRNLKRCVSSIIRKGDKRIQVSYFTSDNNVCGWEVSIYKGNMVVSWRDLQDKNYISDKRIGLVEDEALEWGINNDKTNQA